MAWWDPAHVTSIIKLCMQTKFQFCRSKGVLAKIPLLAYFGPTGTQEGVQHRGIQDPVNTNSKYMWGRGSNFQTAGDTGRHTDTRDCNFICTRGLFAVSPARLECSHKILDSQFSQLNHKLINSYEI